MCKKRLIINLSKGKLCKIKRLCKDQDVLFVIQKQKSSSKMLKPKVFRRVLQKHADLLFSLSKNTENIDSKVLRTKNGRPFLSPKCAVYSNKNQSL